MDEMVGQKNDRGELKASRWGLAGRVARALGPGLVTGAADDDPSGIATYSQVGAQFGYQLSWILLFSYPLMAAMAEALGSVGALQLPIDWKAVTDERFLPANLKTKTQ